MAFGMNKQRALHLGGDPAAQASSPDAAPPELGDAGDDATKAKALIQQLLEVVEHWEQSEKGEEGAEIPPAAADEGAGY